MNPSLRIPKILFITFLSTAITFALLNETGVILMSSVNTNKNNTIDYYLNLISIVLTLSSTFISLRLLVFKKIKEYILNDNETEALKKYCLWTTIRVCMIFSSIAYNLWYYYAGNYSQTALYCLFISLTGCVFCWPSKSYFENYREANKQ